MAGRYQLVQRATHLNELNQPDFKSQNLDDTSLLLRVTRRGKVKEYWDKKGHWRAQ